jgi:hypothetical protein
VAVGATSVRFEGELLSVVLADGRTVTVPLGRIRWLRWLAEATPEQRERWSLEPSGFAVYWEDLDDGFEVEHLLSTQSLV